MMLSQQWCHMIFFLTVYAASGSKVSFWGDADNPVQ